MDDVFEQLGQFEQLQFDPLEQLADQDLEAILAVLKEDAEEVTATHRTNDDEVIGGRVEERRMLGIGNGMIRNEGEAVLRRNTQQEPPPAPPLTAARRPAVPPLLLFTQPPRHEHNDLYSTEYMDHFMQERYSSRESRMPKRFAGKAVNGRTTIDASIRYDSFGQDLYGSTPPYRTRRYRNTTEPRCRYRNITPFPPLDYEPRENGRKSYEANLSWSFDSMIDGGGLNFEYVYPEARSGQRLADQQKEARSRNGLWTSAQYTIDRESQRYSESRKVCFNCWKKGHIFHECGQLTTTYSKSESTRQRKKIWSFEWAKLLHRKRLDYLLFVPTQFRKEWEDWVADESQMVGFRAPAESNADAIVSTPAPRKAAPIPKPLIECTACCEFIVERTAPDAVPCGHRYCWKCLEQFLRNAVVDRSLYPPQCCNTAFPASVSRRRGITTDAYTQKGIEYADRKPAYCHDPNCRRYLAKDTYIRRLNLANCQAHLMGLLTCVLCGKADHGEADCPQDENFKKLLNLSEMQRWKRCYSCGSMVEKIEWCNHMTLRSLDNQQVVHKGDVGAGGYHPFIFKAQMDAFGPIDPENLQAILALLQEDADEVTARHQTSDAKRARDEGLDGGAANGNGNEMAEGEEVVALGATTQHDTAVLAPSDAHRRPRRSPSDWNAATPQPPLLNTLDARSTLTSQDRIDQYLKDQTDNHPPTRLEGLSRTLPTAGFRADRQRDVEASIRTPMEGQTLGEGGASLRPTSRDAQGFSQFHNSDTAVNHKVENPLRKSGNESTTFDIEAFVRKQLAVWEQQQPADRSQDLLGYSLGASKGQAGHPITAPERNYIDDYKWDLPVTQKIKPSACTSTERPQWGSPPSEKAKLSVRKFNDEWGSPSSQRTKAPARIEPDCRVLLNKATSPEHMFKDGWGSPPSRNIRAQARNKSDWRALRAPDKVKPLPNNNLKEQKVCVTEPEKNATTVPLEYVRVGMVCFNCWKTSHTIAWCSQPTVGLDRSEKTRQAKGIWSYTWARLLYRNQLDSLLFVPEKYKEQWETWVRSEQKRQQRTLTEKARSPPVDFKVPPPTPSTGTHLTYNVVDAVIEVLQSHVRQPIGTTSPFKVSSVQKSGSKLTVSVKSEDYIECTACCELIVKTIAPDAVSCGHRYCWNCLGQFYRNSISDWAFSPPQCCNLAFPADLVRRIRLPADLVYKYTMKCKEFEDPKPVYCHVSGCQRYLMKGGYLGLRDIAVCGKHPTPMHTCVTCGKAHHGMTDCPEDEGLKALLALAAEEKWKRCYRCGRMVEKTKWCNHMTCMCKAHFCYVCGGSYKEGHACPKPLVG
ncbi:hypothetical protein BJ508DRAFT_324776 [Ascobolus immersus RN42]|uniref:RBR-type E3 ubiquitin transferase n=1 Tax=Ascobolus immersus RN42 TaxID=1160509 RepID=A0A3N4ICL2_ASCIM|nr:hypothetical protein BJ508DRAFT_324776 [Ascobolus immersus RN42]